MAHVKVETQLSPSESESESDNNDNSSGEEIEERDGSFKTDVASSGGLADVMAAILTKSVSKKSSIILAKGQTDKEIRIRKRRRDKEEGKLKVADSDSDVENKQERIDKRKEWNNMNRVKPNPLERERERRLQRIATRGVVQLFNAVRQQQKTLEEKLTEAGSSIKKTEKAVESMTKGKFLDLLKGTKPSVSKHGDKSREVTQSTSSSDTKWKILRDDFMMGAKMKDWDKESDEEGSSEGADDGGGDMDLSDSE